MRYSDRLAKIYADLDSLETETFTEVCEGTLPGEISVKAVNVLRALNDLLDALKLVNR